MRKHVIVVGAGVLGLTCAQRLLVSGSSVEVWSRGDAFPSASLAAAAFWYPYKVLPADAGRRWGRASLDEFLGLLPVAAAGVSLHPLTVLYRHTVPDPDWRDLVPSFRRTSPVELQLPYVDGFQMDVPVINMTRFLPWLKDRVRAGGASFRTVQLQDLGEALADADVVVNCAGLGARELAADLSVYPSRGQLIRVAGTGLTRLLFDPDGVTYVVPRGEDCILGGTAEDGVEELATEPAALASVAGRCRRLEPALVHARELGSLVGLRPCRPAVRLEAEVQPGGQLLVHNYGHGGAGVTLSYGCADEVAALVTQYLNSASQRPSRS